MAEQPETGAFMIFGGATSGALFSTTVGGMGIVGSFGGLGIGMAPVTVAGATVGAAVYGMTGLIEGDPAAFVATGIGVASGIGVSATVGGMGLTAGGAAIGIGWGTMAAVGGIVGLGVYGVVKMLDKGSKESAAQVFARMEEKILWQEAYTHALIELTFAEDDLLRRLLVLDVEEDLQQLKAEVERQKFLKIQNEKNLQFLNVDLQEQHQENYCMGTIKTTTSSVHQLNAWLCIHTLKHHAAAINAIAISPDNQTVVTASDDRTICLSNLKTGNRIYTWLQPEAALSVAIAPDRTTLVGGGLDRTISRWHLDTKALQDTFFKYGSLSSHAGLIYSIAISGDGKTLASGSADKTIRIWRYDNHHFAEKLKRTLNGHTDTVCSVALNQDGSILVSGSADRTLRIWKLTAWEHPRILTGHMGCVNAVVLSPDGTTIASASADASIKLWNLASGALLCTLTGHLAAVRYLAFSPRGRVLASSSNDGTLKLWRLHGTDDSLRAELQSTLPGAGPIAFSPDGTTLVSGDQSGTIKVWKLQAEIPNESTLRRHPRA